MPINHKFKETDFNNGFQTHNAILDVAPYQPKIMIVGTNNPDTHNANHADFFYGRNFLWTAFKNLFIHNQLEIQGRRMPTNGAPQGALNPTIEEIFHLCRRLELTFADLIQGVLGNGNPQYEILPNDNIIYDGNEYNLIQDGQVENIRGLAQLEQHNQISWNDENIIDYLFQNPSVKTIYFTRRPTGIWSAKWQLIANSPLLHGRIFTNIFTPSGQGSPVHRSMANLLNHWVHNENLNFGRLNNEWLVHHGVELNNF